MREPQRLSLIERNTTHGMSGNEAYSNWKDMKRRCFNKKNKRYACYAGRGISVHADFVDDFPAWLAEIGDKPEGPGWSVGRIDNDGWYTYGNMRWERAGEQARNHSMQANNTSGVTGIKKRTRDIAGNLYTSVTACWNAADGKRRTKDFSADKFGEEEAMRMAIAYRRERLEELRQFGIVYAETHGAEKQ